MTFAENLERNLLNTTSEKTFIDKILAKEDVNRVRDLIKKPRLKREELLELLYLLAGTEAKLVNYGDWDRYIILKFYVWVREFIKVAEIFFDYKDDLRIKEKKKVMILSDRTKKILDNNERLIEHNAKFLIDLYFNIARTTLSLGASGFLETLKNKYEIAYPNLPAAPVPQQENRGLFRR